MVTMTKNQKRSLITMSIATIGVVYGDIGTSPLYALKSCFSLSGLPLDSTNVFGLVSLFAWTLFLVVTVKYVAIVMRVNYRGEGGILALSSLCTTLKQKKMISKTLPLLLGILGASLFFGDGVITPAISILSAFEGLHIISPHLSEYVMPLSILTILALFLLQKRGSAKIGQYFGPIMILWFITIAVLGLYQILQMPSIIKALTPYYAIHFFYENGWMGLIVLGGTILVVTGAEALYADMGHFGAKPIKLTWHLFIFPSLLLNYLGQGALLLQTPEAITNPFYLMAPNFILYPLIILAAAATIIASQAVISGVFSVAWQAIMLNYLPRLHVIHTSTEQEGQVYVPVINYLLCILAIISILLFQSSDNLASAYGLSIAGLMLITTILVGLFAYYRWKWPLFYLLLLFIPLLVLDIIFLTANLVKLIEGAWFTLLLTFMAAYTFKVWLQGNKVLNRQKFAPDQALTEYLKTHKKDYPHKIPGTGIFMTRSTEKVPNALVIHLQHNHLLHHRVIFLSICTASFPRVPMHDKYAYSKLDAKTFAITAWYGFKEVPNLNKILEWANQQGLIEDSTENVSFFFSRGVPVTEEKRKIKGFGKRFYIFLCHNAIPAYDFYKIPEDKVIELGIRYEI